MYRAAVHIHNDIVSIITVLMNHIWYPFLVFHILYRKIPVISLIV